MYLLILLKSFLSSYLAACESIYYAPVDRPTHLFYFPNPKIYQSPVMSDAPLFSRLR